VQRVHASNIGDPIYLNNAATSWPKAPGVPEAVAAWLAQPPHDAARSGSITPADPAADCRRLLARLLGDVDPCRIALTHSATESLNLAILGVGLHDGARVVTTCMEHNSVLRPLAHIARTTGVEVRIVGASQDGVVDAEDFAQALRPSADLVVVNHASNVTGTVQDVGLLFALAHDVGALTLLDASQSAGNVPVIPAAMGADMVAINGHKSLHGPPGVGALYVREGLDLQQWMVGGTGVRSSLRLHPAEMPIRLEAGTPNGAGLAGWAVALRWHAREGHAHVQRKAALTATLRRALHDLPEVRVYGGHAADDRVGIVSVNLRGVQPEDLGFALEAGFRITCRTGLHCAPLAHEAIGSAPDGTVRLSLSSFTRPEEVDAAVSALRRLSARMAA